MSEIPIELDKHRGMVAQKATGIRRLVADAEANAKLSRDQQGVVEIQILAVPATSWPQQIIVLRRTAPKKQSFGAIDRLLFVGLIASSLAFLMRLRSLGPRPSSNGTVRASACTGVGSRDRVVAGRRFRWKYAD